MPSPGLILAAPSSGSGKTLVTLGVLAHLAGRGLRVASAKVGPDYIDPAFHTAATGRPCINLDGWAMRPAALAGLAAASAADADLVVCEGVMGLLDGADLGGDSAADDTTTGSAGDKTTGSAGDGSTADIAARTGWPVVLVVDARGMAASAAAVVAGFAAARADVRVAGAIFNQVSGERHRRMIATACATLCPDIAVLGFMPRLDRLVVPSRHLGLVQACEHPDLPAFLAAAAAAVEAHVDMAALIATARPGRLGGAVVPMVVPPGQRVAVARDDAFAFAYPWLIDGWRRAGAEIRWFSPLADQPPDGDSVYLPGGYPELHAGRLAANTTFLDGLRRLAATGAAIYGECGGFMTLGHTLEDADGRTHALAGLLDLHTSFARRRLHLGYRQVRLEGDTPLGTAGQGFRGHEFHFATILGTSGDQPLFQARDAAGTPLGPVGLRRGRVCASFIHLMDEAG